MESDDVAAAEEIETDGRYLVCEILTAGGGGYNIAKNDAFRQTDGRTGERRGGGTNQAVCIPSDFYHTNATPPSSHPRPGGSAAFSSPPPRAPTASGGGGGAGGSLVGSER